jgi:GNAT superfamily N-acetyltransferase
LLISDGPFERERLLKWVAKVANDYPEYRSMDDRAPAMIHGVLGDLMSGRPSTMKVKIAHDDEILYGLIGFQHSEDYNILSLLVYAVLPKLRRRGAGTALLENVKQTASTMRVPIFAGGMLDDAYPRLHKAGF